MSIVFLPPSSGGAASIADATETTAGKIRIATSGEATTGASDVIAMTPLTVKERIDAALVGGVEYKGIFNVASAAPDLSDGQKGDMYIISGSGSLYGKSWVSGDHLLINEDMGGSISNSKIDKVDNTDQVTSVNAQTGAVSLSGNNLDGDHTASNYSTTSDKIEKHFEGIDNKFGTLGTASTKDTGVANGNVIVADATGLPVIDGSQLTGITATDSTKLAIASNLSDLNNAGTARTNLGVAIGSDVQAHDAGLDSISGLTTVADKMIYTTASDTYAVTGLTSAGRALLDDASASDQRATLGLGGAALKDAGDQANEVLLLNGSGQIPAVDGSLITGITATDSTKLAIASNLSDLNNAGTARTNLGVAIGSDVQAHDAGLDSISGLTTVADKMIYTTASDTYAVTGLTSAGRALLDDASASDQRTTLGLIIGTDVLANVAEDTSPELGGNIDVGAFDIVSSSNGSIDLAPDGTGLTTLRGNTTGGNNPGGLVINAETNSKSVTIKAPLDSGLTSYTLTLPNDDGSPDEVLKTDGSGVLSWTAQSAGGSAPTVTPVTQSTSPYPSSGVLASTGLEQIFIIDPNGSVDVVVNIPAASTPAAGSGFKYQIKNLSASNNLVITPASGTIDSDPSFSLTVENESVTIVSDGSNWFII